MIECKPPLWVVYVFGIVAIAVVFLGFVFDNTNAKIAGAVLELTTCGLAFQLLRGGIDDAGTS